MLTPAKGLGAVAVEGSLVKLVEKLFSERTTLDHTDTSRRASTFWRIMGAGLSVAAISLLAAVPAAHASPVRTSAEAPPSIRQLASQADLHFGTALSHNVLGDAEHMDLVSTWSNTLTFENDTKFGLIQPDRGVWDFNAADQVMDWAVEHEMKVRGHVLIWHQQNPQWLLDMNPTRAEALDLMREHISTVVRHFDEKYPGAIVHWDVVNEALNTDGSMRNTIWRRWIGDDYLAHAFRFAREAAGPDVELYYNDYFDGTMLLVESGAGPVLDAAGVTNGGDGSLPPPMGNGASGPMTCDQVPKCSATRNLLSGLIDDGVPVDGMGFQAHQPSAVPSDYSGLTRWVGELGLKWALTEVDVPMPRDLPGTGIGRSLHQPKGFATPLESCLADPACDTYITWGVSDRYTWWNYFMGGSLPDALPYDENLRAKPAVDAVRAVLVTAASQPEPQDAGEVEFTPAEPTSTTPKPDDVIATSAGPTLPATGGTAPMGITALLAVGGLALGWTGRHR